MSSETERPLHTVLGGILRGFTRAQEIASLALVNFIEQIGFVPDSRGAMQYRQGDGALGDVSIGMMRLVHFRYVRQREDGKDELVAMSVPLLSLVAIPALRVRRASTEFLLELGSLADAQRPTEQQSPPERRRRFNEPADVAGDSIGRVFATVGGDIGLHPVDIGVRLPALAREKAARGTGDGGLLPGLMRVQMEIEAADFPVGIQKLLYVSGISSSNSMDLSKPDESEEEGMRTPMHSEEREEEP